MFKFWLPPIDMHHTFNHWSALSLRMNLVTIEVTKLHHLARRAEILYLTHVFEHACVRASVLCQGQYQMHDVAIIPFSYHIMQWAKGLELYTTAAGS